MLPRDLGGGGEHTLGLLTSSHLGFCVKPPSQKVVMKALFHVLHVHVINSLLPSLLDQEGWILFLFCLWVGLGP